VKTRVIIASLLLASSAPLLASEPPLLKQPGKWAQEYTGRKADPNVRFGTLPNGLRYAIQHNETPSDGVAMRMRIGSGSLQERDEERGLAHFLEHMAFRGSTNVADGEVIHMLERQGLKFGPDTNAFTSQDQTVYMFNFPRGDQTAVDTGLTLFREIGERLKLSPATIEAEKGVVLSEERLRDSAQYRMLKANLSSMFEGTRVTSRWPIGTIETIKGATRDRLSRYYKANYRPDNATVVVVGNVDPAVIEQKIRKSFADWKPASAGDAVDHGTPAPKKTTPEFNATGAPDQLTLTWVAPADRRAETEAVDREILLRRVALMVLNQRLADQAMKPGAPFVGAQAAYVPSLLHTASIVSLGMSASPDKWNEALEAVSAQQRMLLRDGVQPQELQRAITTIKTQLEAKAASSPTRKSSAIADDIVRAANDDALYTSDMQDVAFLVPLLTKAGQADVNAALNALFAKPPILFRSSSQTTAAGEARLAAALGTAYSRTLGAQVREAAIAWPYTSFGKASGIVSQTVDAQLGTTTVRFANGTRLIVKPTRFEKEKIQVAVAVGNGRAGVSPEVADKLWEAQFYPLGGTGKLSLGEITQWAQTTGKVATVNLEAGARAFVLRGSTRPADLLTQMQLLAAYTRDPGFRAEAVDKARSFGPMLGGQIEANAGAVFTRGAQALMVGNDPRFRVLPNFKDVLSVNSGDLTALLRQQLGTRPDVIMVGDVTVADAIRATEATFASGAALDAARAAPATVRVQPRAEPAVFPHRGRADQAFYGEYFLLPDYFADPKTANAADVAASVLQARLVDTVREKLGMTYSPKVDAAASLELQGQGYLSAGIETPPANFAAFHGLLAEQIKDLAANPVSADELARARQPLIEGQRKKLENNGYWLAKLAQVTREPRVRDQVLGEVAAISAVTAADVQAVIAKFVAGKQPIVAIAQSPRTEAVAKSEGGGNGVRQ
jgi:zinc protease